MTDVVSAIRVIRNSEATQETHLAVKVQVHNFAEIDIDTRH